MSKKESLGILFRRKREEKGLLVRQVAAATDLDQAIISRIENGDRLPTREQVAKLCGLYDLDPKSILSAWVAERIVKEFGDEPFVNEAINDAAERILFSYKNKAKNQSKPGPDI